MAQINRTNTLLTISRKLKTFSPSERIAAEYVLAKPHSVALLPLKHLAGECGVSEPTILRFCRALGFSGYQDFKLSLIPQILRDGNLETDEQSTTHTVANRLRENISDTMNRFDDEAIVQAAQSVAEANRIIIVGFGGSAGVGYILADSLIGLGKPCQVTHDISFLQALPVSLKSGDLSIGISHSGETTEVAEFLMRTRERGANTISITNYEKTPVDSAADIRLYTSCSEDLLGSYSPAARVNGLLLIVALIEETGRLMNAEAR